MKAFKTHQTKQIIRSQWCAPLISQLGERLTYLGLPAREALDIVNWKDYIKKIVAFQCEDHNAAGTQDTWEDANTLQETLLAMERADEELNFSLYRGYIEEVILGGRDREGKPFTMPTPVNIFNLDFCNPLTSPLSVFDQNNIPQTYYKIEAIGKLLELQRDISIDPKKKAFVMFVTVHANINEQKLVVHGDELKSPPYEQFAKDLEGLTGIERSIRFTKLCVFNFIKNHFCSRMFVPEFLPPIFYQGTSGHKLLTFTILGNYEKTASGSAPFRQSAEDFLYGKFIVADGEGLSLHDATGITEHNVSLDPKEIFAATHFYKHLFAK